MDQVPTSPTITDWIIAGCTFLLVLITGWYAWLTRKISQTAIDAPQKAVDSALVAEREKHIRLTNELTEGLDLQQEPILGSSFAMRVVNRTDHPLHNVSVLITIDHSLKDIIEPRDFTAWIRAGHLIPVVEERVCWAHQENGKNIPVTDIYAQEELSFALFVYDNKVTVHSFKIEQINKQMILESSAPYLSLNLIKVASGDGFGDPNTDISCNARVALDRKNYRFWVKIVGENIRAKAWECEFIYTNEFIGAIVSKQITINDLRKIQNELRIRENLSDAYLRNLL